MPPLLLLSFVRYECFIAPLLTNRGLSIRASIIRSDTLLLQVSLASIIVCDTASDLKDQKCFTIHAGFTMPRGDF